MSLGQRNKQEVRAWLERLPEEDRQKDEWRYWRGILLMDAGHRAQGKVLLHPLMQERGFYPMAAAEALGERYVINVARAAAPSPALARDPAIARVRELMYWNMDNLARSEWSALVASRSRPEQEQLARYAFLQQ